MDNKKLYKRLSTIFWFTFAIMPIITSLIQCCVILFNSFGGATFSDIVNLSASSMEDVGFIPIFAFQLENGYFNIMPGFWYDLFENLFSVIDPHMPWIETLSCFCAWFTWVFMLELLLDVALWLPKFIHNGLEKWGA